MTGPIPDSYWLVEGLLLAGEYPGTPDVGETRDKLVTFLDAGIRTFLDLTEEAEFLSKYDGILAGLSRERGIETRYVRFGIRDLGLPENPHVMSNILATIDQEMAAGRAAYVHCWGGVGRTGTVVGCWLVQQGLTGRAALARIADLRKGTPDGWKRSPETGDQRRFVLEWSQARASGP